MCSVVFLAFTLKFAIQTSLSVAPKLTVSACSDEKCGKFSKTTTPPTVDSLSCLPFPELKKKKKHDKTVLDDRRVRGDKEN